MKAYCIFVATVEVNIDGSFDASDIEDEAATVFAERFGFYPHKDDFGFEITEVSE
jgi:hypothetical protein